MCVVGPLATSKEKVLTLGRTTTISFGIFPSKIVPVIFNLTISNIGEAFRKSSKHGALCSSPGSDDRLNVVRRGKAKHPKGESFHERKVKCSRSMEPPEMGSEAKSTTSRQPCEAKIEG